MALTTWAHSMRRHWSIYVPEEVLSAERIFKNGLCSLFIWTDLTRHFLFDLPTNTIHPKVFMPFSVVCYKLCVQNCNLFAMGNLFVFLGGSNQCCSGVFFLAQISTVAPGYAQTLYDITSSPVFKTWALFNFILILFYFVVTFSCAQGLPMGLCTEIKSIRARRNKWGTGIEFGSTVYKASTLPCCTISIPIG